MTLKFDLLLKTFNVGHYFLTRNDRAFTPGIAHVYSLWQDLSHGTIIFDLVTLKFDLLLKNFNLGHNFLSDRAFILYMCIPYDKTFHMVP